MSINTNIPSVAVITNCTNRKRGNNNKELCVSALTGHTVEDVVDQWVGRISCAPEKQRAIDLYCGRTITEAKQAADIAGGRLFILSAGLGLVNRQARIPNYDLSVTGNSDANILQHLSHELLSPEDWWSLLTRRLGQEQPLKQLLESSLDLTVILSISHVYLEMLSNEIISLKPGLRRRLRILCHYTEEKIRPDVIDSVMPYDARFDGPDSPRPGTKSDFAQRAAFHFVSEVLSQNPRGSAEEHRTTVEQFLRDARQPVRHNRRKVEDFQVKQMIKTYWSDVDGASGKMLRLLRDREQVACEQSRFRLLFNQVKLEMEQKV